MSWIEVKASFLAETVDLSPYVDLFVEYGIDNTLEEGSTLTGCLVDVNGSAERLDQLREALRDAGAIEIHIAPLVEQNWEEAWKQFFKPRRVGQRFLICPTWDTVDPEPGDLLITLDPGQAFGTGDHPTTRNCLQLLESADLAAKSVADVGCGSGILAIGAVLLGAGSVEAVDIDPIAVEVTKENAATNGVSFRAIAGIGIASLSDPSLEVTVEPQGVQHDDTPLSADRSTQIANPIPLRQFDVVVSNIISATLIKIAPDVAASIPTGGRWIVSGIIEQNWADVQAAAGENGFALREELYEDGWVAAAFDRV